MGLHNRKSLAPFLHDSIDFYKHQVEGVNQMHPMRHSIQGDDMGLGKLGAYSEPILTPYGWVTMGSLSIGDTITGANGKPTTVTGIFEQGVVEITRVTFKDGSYSRCSMDHLWNVITPVRKMRGSGYKTLTTRQILDNGIRDAAGNCKHFIPMVKPVQFNESMSKGQTINAYTLGVLLGDGGLSGSMVSVTTDECIIEDMPLPWDIDFTFQRDKGGGYCVQGYLTQMAKYLRPLGLMGTKSNDKFVPDCYKYGSVSDRVSVIQGLLDTDGTTVASRGKVTTSIEYGTVSPQLAEDMKFLVQSLGGTVSIKEKIPTYTYKGEKLEGQLFYRMVIALPDTIIPFRLERKLINWTARTKYEPSRAIVSIEPDGMEQARCIKVSAEDQLYVTRDFIVTHNTLQAIAVFCAQCAVMAAKIKNGSMEPRDPLMLVVCPSSIKYNWEDEIQKFTTLGFIILDGTPKVREAQLLEFSSMTGPRVLVMNYEQVAKHLPFINNLKVDLAVFDEAHLLKNPKSARTKACESILAWRKLPMTGSPVLNRADELYVMLNMVEPGKHKTYWKFRQRYCVMGGYMDKAIVGVQNETELKAHLNRVMIRRLKKDVLDLPEVQVISKKVGLTALQRKLYDQVKDDELMDIGDGNGSVIIDNPLTKFLRLKQICGTTATVLASGEDKSEKLDQVVADVTEVSEEGHKTVVFTQFRGVQGAFKARIDAMNASRLSSGQTPIPIFLMHGDVPKADRQAMVKRWAAVDGPSIMCGMLQVMGVGLNMTASRHGFFIDKLFVPMLNQQAIDRLNRIGADETQSIQIFEYLVRGTIEARVERILTEKRELFDLLVEPDDWHARLIAIMKEEDAANAA